MINEIEVRFRNEYKKPRKRAKALNEYIVYLLENDHILEANHYLNILLELKPKHDKSLSLGYKIAIRMFDFERVGFFDRELIGVKAKDDLIMFLKLEYYCSIKSTKRIDLCLEWFCEQLTINTAHIGLVIEASLIIKKYELIVKVLKLMNKKRLEPSESTGKIYKEIALEKLVKTLRMVQS